LLVVVLSFCYSVFSTYNYDAYQFGCQHELVSFSSTLKLSVPQLSAVPLGRNMNNRGKIITDIQSLIDVFAPLCSERSTLDELRVLTTNKDIWSSAHNLFDRIRKKNNDAIRQKNVLLATQYLFEEVCAKTFYNLSGEPAPFDADSPYCIIPNALALAKELKIDEHRVIGIVAP
jgi:hypothetical protein